MSLSIVVQTITITKRHVNDKYFFSILYVRVNNLRYATQSIYLRELFNPVAKSWKKLNTSNVFSSLLCVRIEID